MISNLRLRMILLFAMQMIVMKQVKGEKMKIIQVSSDMMIRQGENVNMSCETDQVKSRMNIKRRHILN